MARKLAPSVHLKAATAKTVRAQVKEVVEKQLAEQDRSLRSVRECEFLLSRLVPRVARFCPSCFCRAYKCFIVSSSVQPCRGVGLHHGGLLPLLRELTEKLFKDGFHDLRHRGVALSCCSVGHFLMRTGRLRPRPLYNRDLRSWSEHA